MKSHLRAGLIALASVPVVLAPTGAAAAVTSPVHTFADPTPSVSPSPSASRPASPSAAASPSAPTTANLDQEAPRTNLTAVVDPIAVPAGGHVRIRVGAHNSGPKSITAPAGKSAVGLGLEFGVPGFILGVKSLGGCQVRSYIPAPIPGRPPLPPEPYLYDCQSGRTLRVGETYWQTFEFFNFDSVAAGRATVRVGSGYALDPRESDNSQLVVVRLGKPGSSLPVTGPNTISLAGAGLALVIAGTLAIWYGRRRRRVAPAPGEPARCP